MREYIAKDVVLSEINDNAPFTGTDREEYILASVIEIVRNTPAADVEPVKHGKWLSAVMDDDCNETVEYCSECHYVRPRNSWKSDFNYCPKCGAKNDGGSEEDG